MSLWMDLYSIISQDVRFTQMLGQTGGSSCKLYGKANGKGSSAGRDGDGDGRYGDVGWDGGDRGGCGHHDK